MLLRLHRSLISYVLHKTRGQDVILRGFFFFFLNIILPTMAEKKVKGRDKYETGLILSIAGPYRIGGELLFLV